MTNNDIYNEPVELMTKPTNIERVVMRRVLIIRALRPLLSSGTLAGVVGVVALWGIGRQVWVAQVFNNGPQDFFGHTLYLTYAFINTDLIVQTLSLLTLISLVYVSREFIRVLSTNFSTLAHV